jgi:hypothetical protein
MSATSSRRQIEKLIEKSEFEIFEMHKAIDMRISYVQGLRDTLKYLPKDSGDTAVESQLRPGTTLAKAYDFLKAEGKPVHVMDLLKQLGKEPSHKNRVSLSGSIGFYVRRKQFFTRPAPNTFGVIDRPENQESNGASQDEPPENFGIEEEKVET